MTIYKLTQSIKHEGVELASDTRLVEAKTKAQAVAHVAFGSITVSVATVADAVALSKDGVEIEKAGEKEAA